ncbi:hypothetical protein EX30DRAFT_364854 [Ascodesmis nigricans]|uniref:NTF2-like protein n=1 Tax=Ascodesmis nigricans TaxID=341454 RepID=A0A4V3SIH3_9PEZI|nr:hypothetical protein EX30DRAFT_364854 [Ascodesmis nigricans]
MSTFQNSYLRFLSSPSESAISSSAELHYISSGTSLSTPDEIVKYLSRESRLLKKKSEKVLSSVQVQDTLVLEVETELEFVTSGGNYLPGLDDNFLADHVVVFPIIHFVTFENGKVKQARLFWDQATLLKQVGVIGRSGRNWPIRDGREQAQRIAKSVAAAGSATSFANADPFAPSNGSHRDVSAASSSTGESPRRGRAGRTSSNAMRDPHASLSLFDRNNNDEELPRPIAPRSNSDFRPPSRDLHAIIGPDEGEVPRPLPPKARSSYSRGQSFSLDEDPEKTPSKPVLPPKARSSFSKRQTFTLGEEEEAEDENATPKSAQKTVNVNPKKYHHFEFGNGEDAAPQPKSAAKASTSKKNGPSWGFEDFMTPEKVVQRNRPDNVRNFTWSDDEEPEQDSPVKPKKLASRKDADTHFSLKDEDTPEAKKPLVSVGNTMHNRSSGNKTVVANGALPAAAPKKKIDDDNFYGDDNVDFFANFGEEVKHGGIAISGNGQGCRVGTEQTIGGTHARAGAQKNGGGIKIAGNGQGNRTGTEQTVGGTHAKNANGASEGFWDY